MERRWPLLKCWFITLTNKMKSVFSWQFLVGRRRKIAERFSAVEALLRLLRTSHHKLSTPRGFTLVELLVYLASMTMVLLAVIYMIVGAYGLYSTMLVSARADRAAGTLMQVLGSELRSGSSIDQSGSVFGSSQGQLTIAARNDGLESEKIFRLEDDRVVFSNDGVDTFMTPEDILVSKLLFNQISTPLSYAVRYEMDLTFPIDGEMVTNTYAGVIVLRHSYE